ncbi:sulfatase-like hydrolase/transferase [Paenibacillus sp. F411]|uniref:sulfatase family protein n=1 Tax=Paenibacillus sp. F411 TaxID=2820239 RepID=UPI001AAEE2DA|nr:sulfatase-like hydrolase/transferase [Paenibacillus sp. F411]MBO2944382.1 sulfatase-like hydrolase/transferase [Paenibacillus sp. F411]
MEKRQPNILFLIMDDTQKDCLGCYKGKGQVLTPNIDAIAREGVRFERAYCSSTVCTPSRYSYLTGHYAGRNRHELFKRDNPDGEISKVNFNVAIDENVPNVLGLLNDAGYETGYVGKYHCGRKLGELNIPKLAADADPYDPAVDQQIRELQAELQAELKRTTGVKHARSIAWGNIDEMPVRRLRYHHLEWMTQGALELLDTFDKERPFFLYYATSSFHGPLHHDSLRLGDPCLTWSGSDPELAGLKEERQQICEELEAAGLPINHQTVGAYWTDKEIGKVIAKLEQMGELDNTLIVYASDHNVEPGKASCYEFGTRIPLILRWPDGFGQGTVNHDYVQNIDLVPTLLEAAGVQPPSHMQLDGREIRGILEGEEKHRSLYFEMGFLRAVLMDEWKYISLRYPHRLTELAAKGELDKLPNHLDMPNQHQPYVTMDVFPHALDADQLYDLRNDPTEQCNLAAKPEHQQRLRILQMELNSYLATFPDHPYDLDDRRMFELPHFPALKQRLLERGLGPVSWWSEEDSERAKERMPYILRATDPEV